MKTILSFAAAALVAGCASYGGAGLPPGATQAQVRAVMGSPALELPDALGASTWAFPRGPLGYDTFMVRFTSAGALARIDSVLNPEHFARVSPGLDRDGVLRVVGPPGRTNVFALRGELAWDYRFMDAWGYPSYFTVIFDAQGRVRSTLTWREHFLEDH